MIKVGIILLALASIPAALLVPLPEWERPAWSTQSSWLMKYLPAELRSAEAPALEARSRGLEVPVRAAAAPGALAAAEAAEGSALVLVTAAAEDPEASLEPSAGPGAAGACETDALPRRGRLPSPEPVEVLRRASRH